MSLHRALGMTLKTTDPGLEENRGPYTTDATLSGVYKSLKHVMSSRMSLFNKGSNVSQLGGEFIFGPGYAISPLTSQIF